MPTISLWAIIVSSMLFTISSSGVPPSSGDIESLSVDIPVYSIKSETARPIYPSIFISKILEIPRLRSTAKVAAVSDYESFAVAIMDCEFIESPIFRLNKYIQPLIRIAPISIITEGVLKLMFSGIIIFPTDDLQSSKPITSIITDTNNALIYSNLPCPKGWSWSAGLLDSLMPMRV